MLSKCIRQIAKHVLYAYLEYVKCDASNIIHMDIQIA